MSDCTDETIETIDGLYKKYQLPVIQEWFANKAKYEKVIEKYAVIGEWYPCKEYYRIIPVRYNFNTLMVVCEKLGGYNEVEYPFDFFIKNSPTTDFILED